MAESANIEEHPKEPTATFTEATGMPPPVKEELKKETTTPIVDSPNPDSGKVDQSGNKKNKKKNKKVSKSPEEIAAARELAKIKTCLSSLKVALEENLPYCFIEVPEQCQRDVLHQEYMLPLLKQNKYNKMVICLLSKVDPDLLPEKKGKQKTTPPEETTEETTKETLPEGITKKGLVLSIYKPPNVDFDPVEAVSQMAQKQLNIAATDLLVEVPVVSCIVNATYPFKDGDSLRSGFVELVKSLGLYQEESDDDMGAMADSAGIEW